MKKVKGNENQDSAKVAFNYGTHMKNVLQIFSYVAEGKHITARTVADELGLELNSAGNRLKKLYDAHLTLRLEQSAESGGKFEYFLP